MDITRQLMYLIEDCRDSEKRYAQHIECLKEIIDELPNSNGYDGNFGRATTLLIDLAKEMVNARYNTIENHDLFYSLLNEVTSHFGFIEDRLERCEYGKHIVEKGLILDQSFSPDGQKICDDCFMENFFKCGKCKNVFKIEDKVEEDGDEMFCAECSKPVGFPKTVYIAPDFENCEYSAFADLDAALRRAGTGWGETMSYSDLTKLTFANMVNDKFAIYMDDEGRKYEIRELDFLGEGDMEYIEDDE